MQQSTAGSRTFYHGTHIHNPPETLFIRAARARGCETLDGLGMLVNQGVLGIQYWTGVEVDALVMRQTLEEIFGINRKL